MQPFKTSLQAFFQISRATTEWQSELISRLIGKILC